MAGAGHKLVNLERIRRWLRSSLCFLQYVSKFAKSLRWRHNDQDGVSNHQPHGCLLNRLFRCRSNKTSKLRVTGLCVGNSPGPVNSPHKGPVTRKMFPFDDVIMVSYKQCIRCRIRKRMFPYTCLTAESTCHWNFPVYKLDTWGSIRYVICYMAVT